MQVAKDFVVSIDYTLTDDQKNILDSSSGGAPLSYLHGHRNIIPGLENALLGKSVGDKLMVTVQPSEGYGERNEKMIITVPRSEFQGMGDLKVGMQFQLSTSQGLQIFSVAAVAEEEITLDGNHPLAGQQLHFEVQIKEIRPASAEELQHGHAHGAGGHHH